MPASNLNAAFQFSRQFGVPLDKDLVFTTTSARTSYLTDPSTSGIAYTGMIAADLQTNKAYLLNSNRQWVEIGASATDSLFSGSGLLFRRGSGENNFATGGLNSGNNIVITDPSGLAGNPSIGLSTSLTNLSSIAVTGLGNITINSTGVSLSGHSHTSSSITDFNSAVSGLLPTIANNGDNRLLTSTGTSTGINAENNLTFSNNNLTIGSISGLNPSEIHLYSAMGESANLNFKNSSGSDKLQIIYDEGDGAAKIISSDPLTITANVYVDLPGTDNAGLYLNGVHVSVSGHNHTASNITDFSSAVNNLIDSAVSTSIVAGTGVGISYNNTNNTLTVSSLLTAGSGISLSHSSGNYTVSLSDPTVQLVDVTDLTSNARNFLLTPSSANLRTLVTDETGSGSLVFSNSPTLVTPNIGVATGTSFNSITGLSSSTPLVNGTAAVGTSTAAARADHVHPTDTSRAAVTGTLEQFASTTSSQLAGVISDETGSGSLVFGTNPTISSGILAGTSSMNVFNTTATTVNAFGTATTLNLGYTGNNASTTNIATAAPAFGTKTINIGTNISGSAGSPVNINLGGGSGIGDTINIGASGNSNINIGTSTAGLGTRTINIGTDGASGSTTSIILGTPGELNNTTTIRNNIIASGNLILSGSGLVASNINNFDTAVRSSRLDQMAVPTASVSLNSQKITNLATPTNDQDAATKAYVDAARAGLDVKQSVRMATTGPLSGSITGTIILSMGLIDSVVPVVGNRILVKDQTNPSENGIYTFTTLTNGGTNATLTRATDADSSEEVTAGMFTFVSEGSVNADSGWVLTTNDTITLGTTALTFAQFSGAGQITAGAGLTKSGNTLDIGTASSSRIVINADNIDLATVSQSDNSGSSGTSFVQSVTRDSYGRVTGVTTGGVQDASTTQKGIASFDSGDFSVSSGDVSIKSGGVDNSQLANSSVTVGSTNISLGGTSTSLSGLTSVSSTGFTGALTGNASTATTLQTARTINGTSFNGSADITISFIDGGTP